jgi:hypothetical protein
MDVMSQAYNPSYLGGRDLEDLHSRSARQSSKDPISTNAWVQGCVLVIPAIILGITDRKITVQACPGIKQDPISKITNRRRAGGMAQEGEHLPSKFEILSSTPDTESEDF